jgi:hypothetical protein
VETIEFVTLPYWVLVIDSVEKVRIFARRTSDLLSVISLILYLRGRRTTDRTSDVARSTEPLTESIVV